MDRDIVLGKNTLIAVMLSSLATTFIGSSINLALPSISSDFGSSGASLSWIVNSYILASAAFLLPMGKAADILGRKKIFQTGVILFAVFSLLCATSWSGSILIFFRVLQGIAASMIYCTGMAILSSVYPAQKRGQAMGIAVTATYIGLSLGPVLGGFMSQHLGWKSIFCLTALISFSVAAFTFYRIKEEWRSSEREKFDVTGSVLYMSGLVALLYSLSFLTTFWWAKYLLAAGFFLLAAFGAYEFRTAYPLFDVKLFARNSGFIFSNLAAMINYSTIAGVMFLLSLYLQVVLGLTPQSAGFVLLAEPVAMASLSSLAGALSDRIEPRIVASFGMGLTGLGLFMFIFLTPATSLWLIIANLVFIGAGLSFFVSPNNNAIMSSVKPRFYGIASSSISIMRLVGQSISMAIAGLLMSHYMGTSALTSSSAGMLAEVAHTAFIIYTLLCLIGIFVSLKRGSMNAHKQQGSTSTRVLGRSL